MVTNLLQSPARILPDLRPMDAMCPADAPVASTMSGRRLSLARHQIFTIKHSDGIHGLKMLRGTIWLTGTPGHQDVLLSPESHFVLGQNAPFVLEALADAELILLR